MTDWHFYEPTNGHGLAHDPLNSIVAPRPIGWISTLAEDGTRNIAPYSFFNLLNYRPAADRFLVDGMEGQRRERRGDRGVRVEPRHPAACRGDERDRGGGRTRGRRIRAGRARDRTVAAGRAAPRVADSPVAFECRLTQLIRLETKEGRELDQWLVIGEAVGIHIDRRMLVEGSYKTALAEPILRGGGQLDYFTVTEDQRFEMRRPG